MTHVQQQPRKGLLSRLRRDTTGNTLMLVAGAIIPLTGMIGAGVDISRTYLVKSRLQQACDAGALAARKFKTGTTLDAATITKARAFFDNNFPAAAFGTTNISFTPTLDADNEVLATAVARVPMTVMTIFGNTHTDLSVTCNAKMEVGNTDVALVLDVTYSMNTVSGSKSRIAALKESVNLFYNTLGPGDPVNGRVRYAVIPYGQNVNVGYSLPSSYIIGGTGPDTWNYQTRVANMTKPHYLGTPAAPETLADQVYPSAISQSNCARYGSNISFSGFAGGSNPANSGGPPPTSTVSTAYSNNNTAGVDWGYGTPTTASNRICRRHVVRTTTSYTIDGYEQATSNPWTYRSAPIEVSGYASGSPVAIFTGTTVPVGQYVPFSGQYDMRALLSTPGSTVTGGTNVTWPGCIEERDTVSTINGSTSITSVPSGAYDLEIDLLPSNDATTWRPTWDRVYYSRNSLSDTNSGSNEDEIGCPNDRARRLMEYTSITSSPTGYSSLSSFQSYINGLTLTGGTMHDIGFLWGARFLSSTGIFATDNPTSWNGQPVAKHIIFMTDGEMNAQSQYYVFHGYNQLDQRVAPRGTTNSDLNPIHNRRMRIACEQAKTRNMTVWIIAFGDATATNSPDLAACASSAGHFKTASDDVQLREAFSAIANAISELRLTT